MKQPSTPAEWQEVVDLAQAMSLVHAAREYGLVTGGPVINIDRCQELLNASSRLGFKPNKAAVDQIILELSKGNQ